MEINATKNKLHNVYLAGFLIVALLPILISGYIFFPADWGKTILFRSIIAILLLLFVWQFIYKRDTVNIPKVKKNKVFWALIALFLIYLLATIFSQDIYFSLWGSPYRSGGAITFFAYIIFAVLAFFILKKEDWQKFWDISIIAGILVSFVAIIQYYGLLKNIFVSAEGRPLSTLGNPILLGVYLLLLSFITVSFALKEKIRWKKIFYIVSLTLFLYIILTTGSRAAYLGVLAGAIYLILFFPKRDKVVKNIKIATLVLLMVGALVVYYVNTTNEFPKFLQDNKIFQNIQPRLSLELVLEDPRFSAWQITFEVIKSKPILGYGPENFAIGFDKFYDPSLPYISKQWGGWWDRAHNTSLETATTAGIPALLIYLGLFVFTFWQLQKSKPKSSEDDYDKKTILIHGLQASLIGYFVANLFSFDSFSSYLIFFSVIAYSLHLTYNLPQEETEQNFKEKKGLKIFFVFILCPLLIWFLWQYNLKPLQINAKINKANSLAESSKCEQSFAKMDEVFSTNSFLYAYSRMKDVDNVKACAAVNPEKNLDYVNRSIPLMKDALKIRPNYARLWMFLGSFTTIKANAEQDPKLKQQLIQDAQLYFTEAFKLAPKHQENLTEQAKLYLVTGNFELMNQNTKKCIEIDSSLGECYWIKALSEIYMNQPGLAKDSIQEAYKRSFETYSVSALHQLANAYAAVEDYNNLKETYKKLTEMRPDIAQYHSSLAFTYAQLGEYQNAYDEAMIFLQLMPEAKTEVDAFLKSIGY